MHINVALICGSAVVGFFVGLTGMGGGALMTPMLVLLFNVKPASAISSDLVAALFMKPIGVAIHWKRQTVNKALVKHLSYGSVPGALLGAATLHQLGGTKSTQTQLATILGVALLIGAVAMVARLLWPSRHAPSAQITLRPVLTILVGLVGGFMVGLTSVGAGSLILVLLTFLYPAIAADVLVGTDLAQALPLTAAATLGAFLFGHVSFGLTTAIIVGAVPAVFLGAHLSSRGMSTALRPYLAALAFISGCKYVGLPIAAVGAAAVVALALAVAISLRTLRTSRVPVTGEQHVASSK